jgi:hypothetical protein
MNTPNLNISRIKVKLIKNLIGNKNLYDKYIGQIGTIQKRLRGNEIKDDCFIVNMPDGVELLCHNREIEIY